MIPVFKPCYGVEELEALRPVLESGWVGLGPKTQEFEEKFARYIGVKYAVATNSCTAALHMSLYAMEVSRGEVITTPMTFISTNHAVLYNSATPVFCDIEPDTLNIDADQIEPLISKRTKAIIVVHYGGYACDMDRILAIARSYNLKVVEDGAHACGGMYKDRMLGGIGDIGCFSFHAVKNLATGEGGMITTNDPEVYKRLLKFRWMGITRDTWSREEEGSKGYSWYYDVEEMGYKYHMNDIPAAIGLVQLSKLERTNKRREAIVERYNAALQKVDWITTPVRKPYQSRPAYHNYVIQLDRRDELNQWLKDRGISTGVHYIPNNMYKMYKEYRGDTPVAHDTWTKLLTLPLYPDLTDEQVDYIIGSVVSFK